MPTYIVTTPDGKKLKLTGDSPPTDEDIDQILAERAESKVQMKDPNTKLDVNVPQSKVIDASKQGLNLNQSRSISKAESLGRGVAQGATGGFADELAGASEAFPIYGMNDPFAKVDRSKVTTSADRLANYRKVRDEYREADDEASAANPKTFLAGNIGGGLALPVGKAAVAAKGATKLASIGKAALQGAKTGAKVGAITGIGQSEAEAGNIDELDDLAIDSVLGAGLGAAAGGTIGGLAKTAAPLATKTAEYLRSKAKDAALSGAGVMKSLIKNKSDERISNMGEELLENPKLNKVFERADTKLATVEDLAKIEGAKLGEIYKFIDQYDLTQIPYKQLKDSIIKGIGKQVQTKQVGTPDADRLASYNSAATIFRDFDQLAKKQGGNLNAQQLKRLKDKFNDFAYPTAGKTKPEADAEIGQKMAGKVTSRTYDAINDAGKEIDRLLPITPPAARGVPNQKFQDLADNKNLVEDFSNTNKKFGTLTNIQELTKNLRDQELGNRAGPNLKSMVGLISDNPIVKALGIYGTRPGQRAAAKGLNSLSKTAQRIDGSTIQKPIIEQLSDSEPDTSDDISVDYNSNAFDADKRAAGIDAPNVRINELLETSPQSLGKYAKQLASAKARGEDSLKATIYVLQASDPEFRKAFQDSEQ